MVTDDDFSVGEQHPDTGPREMYALISMRMYKVSLRWIRNRTTPLLLSLIALFAVHPFFVKGGGIESPLFPLLLDIVPLLGILCVGSWRQGLVLVVWALALVVAAGVLHDFNESAIVRSQLMFGFIGYYATAIAMLGFQLTHGKSLLDDRVIGGLAIYLLTVVLYAMLHHHISAVNPDNYTFNNAPLALRWNDSLYFSTVIMTTVGFGDIVPIGPWARAAAMLEAFTGVILLVLFIGRLAALPRSGSTQSSGHH